MKGKRMCKFWIFAFCLAVLLPAGIGAQQQGMRRAQFAGTWQLDVTASSLGSDHPSANYAFTKTFEPKQEGFVLKDHEVNVNFIGIAIPQRDSVTELIPDGKEHQVQGPGLMPGMPPAQIKLTAAWQGDNLVITEVSAGFGGSTTTRRRYYLSDDGNRLTEFMLSSSGFGDVDQKLIFTRASEAR
jgi:hypothetical protein